MLPTLAPTPTPGKTVDSDQLQPSFDSDSAAVVVTLMMSTLTPTLYHCRRHMSRAAVPTVHNEAACLLWSSVLKLPHALLHIERSQLFFVSRHEYESRRSW